MFFNPTPSTIQRGCAGGGCLGGIQEGVIDERRRVLVGTRKGAFVLTADGKRERWDITGPHFGGWEIYHLKGSPADPNRLYASQGTGWFGQLIQRSNDGGKTWEPVGNKFVYDGVPGRISGTTARPTPGSSSGSGISNRR